MMDVQKDQVESLESTRRCNDYSKDDDDDDDDEDAAFSADDSVVVVVVVIVAVKWYLGMHRPYQPFFSLRSTKLRSGG